MNYFIDRLTHAKKKLIETFLWPPQWRNLKLFHNIFNKMYIRYLNQTQTKAMLPIQGLGYIFGNPEFGF